ncbi:MAG: CBS domain-containing protein [Thaumarchaeota archaeon]|nr:CBS domain-containing protein [Candidatus Calditenuaceae archaeon]MCX8203412.1 CBS domain-containing protein [Nitrososphaeria archaeon]MDW8043271.1 CBS domain-containing protein [Nitrososphaerota archaeon]
MKETPLTGEILVRDVMTSPVIELSEEATAADAAQQMAKYRISSVLVMRGNEPVGIVTKRDLVEKVVAKDLKPSEVKLRDVMSSPIITVSPEATIEDAMRTMNKLNVSRLVVAYRGRIAGIISMKDILKFTPDIIEIVREQLRIRGIVRRPEPYYEGYCDSCGEWSDMLLRVDDSFLCEECRLESGRETVE